MTPIVKRKIKQGLLVALLVWVLGQIGFSLSDKYYSLDYEQHVGLPWLFKLRGEIPASNDVVVVSIDQESARSLKLPAKPRKWPRNYHGQLVEQLTAHGATAIGFDIIFDETREHEDNLRFAEGLKKAGNVILFQFIQQKEVFAQDGRKLQAEHVSLIYPLEILSDKAQGMAPFPLPKVPAQVNHVVLYKDLLSDAPTLPVVMLQQHASSEYKHLIAAINRFQPALADKLTQKFGLDISKKESHRGIQNVVAEFRQIFLQHPKLAGQIGDYLKQADNGLKAEQIKRLAALINVYRIQESIYLNFYGGLGSIKTIPYYKVLRSDPNNPSIDVKGKAVFVGFSERFQPEQKDGFYTVFTDENSGSDVSGVEIIATAFANLVERDVLMTSNKYADKLLLLLLAMFVSLILRFTQGLMLIPMTLILGLSYGFIVYYSFSIHHYWLPFITPLVVQLGLASLLCFALQYREIQKERKMIRQVFGYHLPVAVVDKIAKGINPISHAGENVHGIIMATDAQQYTRLSEALSPSELHDLMNQYYAELFAPIREHDGIVSDVVGDAAVAIWAAAPDKADTGKKHQQACLAALKIQTKVKAFNLARPEHALPTRIGLDSGELVMGHVGALDHYEYRAIGDIVNTASRIEGVNKQLGTTIIASANVLRETEGLISRELGLFWLVGKQNATSLHELIASDTNQLHDDDYNLYQVFAEGLHLFRSAEFQQALAHFERHPQDGPSRFYSALCQEYLSSPPKDFDGSIHLRSK